MTTQSVCPSKIMVILCALFVTLAHQIVDAAEPKVVTVPVPSGGRAMFAKTDGRGDVHLICDSSDGPYYIRFDDQQREFVNPPVPLVDSASRRPGLEFIAWDLAVSADGTVHVALGNNAWKLKLPKEEWGYFYTRRSPSEKSFSPLQNINRIPSEGFSLAVNSENQVTAVWMADKLYANVSHDGGKTFAKAVEIDRVLDPCNCCTTSCVYGTDGRLAILYREETNNERDMYVALWDQGQGKVTRTRISHVSWKIDSCPMTYYAIVPTAEGYVAAWPTKGDIYFTHLNQEARPLEPAEIKTPGHNGMRSGILPITDRDGRTLITWKKDGQLGWQLYDRGGRPSGDTGSVKSTGSGAAGVLGRNGDLILFQ